MSGKMPKILALPIYVLVDEETKILPSAKVEYKRPSELPENGNYYVLTSEGLHIAKDSPLVKGIVPLGDENDNLRRSLAVFSKACKLRLPKIPPLVLARAWAFFARVFDKHHSESEVMLLYNYERKLYDLWCPEQTVSFGGVNYKMSEQLQAMQQELLQRGEKWQWVGTIHSHCDFSAYHSGTDIDDEKDSDGIHITVGHVNQKACSLSACAVIGKKRWGLPIDNVVLGVERTTGESARKGYYISTSTTDDFYKIALSEDEQAELEGVCAQQIAKQWMPRVTKQTYGNYYGGGSIVWTREDVPDDAEEDGEWRLLNGVWKFLSWEDIAELGPSEDEKDARIAAETKLSNKGKKGAADESES